MGREIRMVPPNWKHPRYTEKDVTFEKRNLIGELRPLFDKAFEDAADEWTKELLLWVDGKHPDQLEANSNTKKYKYYWEWAGEPPDAKYYRPKWTTKEATHYQVYETVTEGTPVTPHFATKEELINHLIEHGTVWDDKGWPRANAESFVNSGWAPSMIYTPATGMKTVNEEGFPLK